MIVIEDACTINNTKTQYSIFKQCNMPRSKNVKYSVQHLLYILSNFNGSNSFGTMQISSRQGKFKPVRVDYSARSGGLIGISF